jgi:hypothetical protein
VALVAAPAIQQTIEIVAIERLGQIVVHAGVEALAAILFEGIGRYGDDRRTLGCRMAWDASSPSREPMFITPSIRAG